MNNKFIYSVLFFLASFGCAFAQNDVTDDFMQYMTSSDYRGVSNICSDFVEIETDKYEETTSKSQVGFILKDFFANHPPNTFEYSHIGTSPGGAKYAIATYFSKKGIEFLIVVKFKLHNGNLLIDTIKVTPE